MRSLHHIEYLSGRVRSMQPLHKGEGKSGEGKHLLFLLERRESARNEECPWGARERGGALGVMACIHWWLKNTTLLPARRNSFALRAVSM